MGSPITPGTAPLAWLVQQCAAAACAWGAAPCSLGLPGTLAMPTWACKGISALQLSHCSPNPEMERESCILCSPRNGTDSPANLWEQASLLFLLLAVVYTETFG